MAKAKRPIGRRTGAAGRRLFWGMSAGVAVACGLALFHVWIRVATFEASYRKGAATQENLRLSAERQQLDVEVGRLKSAPAVRKAAIEALGMAAPVEVVVVPRERTAKNVRDAKRGGEREAKPGRSKADGAAEPELTSLAGRP